MSSKCKKLVYLTTSKFFFTSDMMWFLMYFYWWMCSMPMVLDILEEKY